VTASSSVRVVKLSLRLRPDGHATDRPINGPARRLG
jgi:hypothetical protein